jgi:hypothetical protein
MIAPKILPRKKIFPSHPPKPYSDRKRGNRLTIAAGFCCSDGVVLCADTQYTVPETMKYPDSKLRMVPELHCLPFFVFCGDIDFQKQCVSSFTSALSEAEGNGTNLHSALEQAVLKMHIAH